MSSEEGGDVTPLIGEETAASDVEKRLLQSSWGDEDAEDESNNLVSEAEAAPRHWASSVEPDEAGEGEDDGPEESEEPAYSWKRSDGKQSSYEADEEDDGDGDGDEEDGASESGNVRALPTGIDDLPLFADEKNKALHKKIRAKEKQFQSVKSEIAESASRVEIMTEHLKNVKQELLHTQELHNAKLKEVASEEHMKQLAERETGRMQQDMRKLDAECSELESKLSSIQTSLFKGNEEMDRFKLQMNWNQDEMEQWATAARQKEEDALALERYRRADESKIKELTLEIEKLTRTLHTHKRQVEDEATETQAKQIELDKTADEFRQLHDERQKLIAQWQGTIEAMQRRDEEIAAASEQYALAQQALQLKKDALAEQRHRLKQQEQENTEAQAKIAAKERQQSKVQMELQQAMARLQEFRDQVEVLKNQLSSSVSFLNQQRSSNANKSDYLEALKQELESARARYKATKKALEACQDSTADAETLAKAAEEDLAAMEGELRRVDKEMAAQKELMFRRSQQLFALRQSEASLIAEISGSKAATQNLRTKLKLLDQQALRQQEIVYNSEFQIQQMERKVARASGERSADETKALQAQIQVLQMELDRVKAEESMLVAQCKKLEDEKRAQERVRKALLKHKEEVDAKIAETELANESCAAALKQALKDKEELLIQHDLQALEVRRLKDVLNLRADEVLSLENRDFQLKKSMEERKKEIAVHRELQRATNKALEDERHKVSVELAERESRVKKLQAKFETLCKASGLGGGDDAGGEERSQAFFVIRAAQRREELQREGDELDDKIRVAEKEVRALKKTLEHVEERNSAYRKSFQRADAESEDAQRLLALEEQAKQAEGALFAKKKELARVDMDIEGESTRLKEIETQRQFTRANVAQLESAAQQADREVAAERLKWSKALKKLERQVREHHKFTGEPGVKTREQLMLETLRLKELAGGLLYTLGQLAGEFSEIDGPLQAAVREHGLQIPAAPPGRVAAARAHQASAALAGDYALPRPGSARSDKSDRSVRSSASGASSGGSVRSTGSSGSGARIAAPISTVRFGM